MRPKWNKQHFANDIFKHIFLNENVSISIKISLKFVSKVRINNIPALVQIIAWRRPGDKPLSEPMMVNLPTHICVTRPQWVKFWDLVRFLLEILRYVEFVWSIDISVMCQLAWHGATNVDIQVIYIYRTNINSLIVIQVPYKIYILNCSAKVVFTSHQSSCQAVL